MQAHSNNDPIIYYIKKIIKIALVLAIIYLFHTIILILIIAAVITLIGRPLYQFFRKIRIKDYRLAAWVASTLTLLCFYIIAISLLFISLPIVINQLEVISKINIDEIAAAFSEPIATIQHWLDAHKIDFKVDAWIRSGIKRAVTKFVQGELLGSFIEIINNIGQLIFIIGSSTFIAFFFLKKPGLISAIFITITPQKYLEKTIASLPEIKHLLRRYIVGLILQLLVFSLIASITLSILDVPSAFLIGFLAGIFNIIPYVGPILGGSVGVMLAITENINGDFYTSTLPIIIKIIGAISFTQLIDNNITSTYIFSKSIEAHPLEIFLVVIMASTVGGVAGMVVAVPVYTVIRVVAKNFIPNNPIVQALYLNSEDEHENQTPPKS